MPKIPLSARLFPRGEGGPAQRILEAAARIFGRDGFQGATMNAVAAAAGVSKGLLHYHFQSKEHLLIEAQTAVFRQVYRRFEERVQRGERGLSPALEGLDALYQSVRELRAWAPFMVETLSLSTGNPAVRARLDQFYSESMPLLEQGIEQAFAADARRMVLPTDRMAFLLRVCLHGLIVELVHARTEDDLKRVDQAYQDMRWLFARHALSGMPAGEAAPEVEIPTEIPPIDDNSPP